MLIPRTLLLPPLFLLCLLSLAHADCPQRFSPLDPPPTRIIAGAAASENLYKSVVAVYSSDRDNPVLLCTATLVAVDWLLTAASCSLVAGSLVLHGVPDFAGATPDDFVEVTDVFRSPRYNDSTGKYADIAAAKLGRSLDDATPLRVNVLTSIPARSVYVRVVGFGGTDRNDTKLGKGTMRQADIPVLEDDKCPNVDRVMQTCAGFLEDGACGPCWGDHGAPVLQYSTDDDSSAVIVGVVSRVACDVAAAHTFTRTATFVNWLEQVSDNNDLNFTPSNSAVIEVSTSKRLSTGVIVGIAVAAAVALLLLAVLVFLLVRRRRRRVRKNPAHHAPVIPFSTNSARPAIEQANTHQQNNPPEDPRRGDTASAVTSPPWNPASSVSSAATPHDSSQHTFVVPARAPSQAPFVPEILPAAENTQQYEHSGSVAPNPSPAQTPGGAQW